MKALIRLSVILIGCLPVIVDVVFICILIGRGGGIGNL